METERKNNKKGKRFKGEKKVNKNRIIIILIALVVIVLIASVSIFFRNSTDIEVKEELRKEEIEIKSNKLLEEKIYKEIKIKNISLKIDESASYFKCELENDTDKRTSKEDICIVFLKEDNSELARFKYQINSIEPKANEKINIVTTNRLTDAHDFYIEEVK